MENYEGDYHDPADKETTAADFGASNGIATAAEEGGEDLFDVEPVRMSGTGTVAPAAEETKELEPLKGMTRVRNSADADLTKEQKQGDLAEELPVSEDEGLYENALVAAVPVFPDLPLLDAARGKRVRAVYLSHVGRVAIRDGVIDVNSAGGIASFSLTGGGGKVYVAVYSIIAVEVQE